MNKSKAFTIIELLVVVTIIVVLLALLTPAMDKAMEQAERTVCGAQVNAFAKSMIQYAIENKRKYLASPRHFSHQVAYPLAVYMYADTHWGDFSVEAINPYLGITEPLTPTMGIPKMWQCPSNATASREAEWNAAIAQGRGATSSHDGSFIHAQWGIYAGVDQWKGYAGVPSVASNPEDLAKSKLGSQGIIIADAIYRHASASWLYNHGEYSVSDLVPMPLSGVNHGFGDGSVKWSEFSDARRDALVPGFGDSNNQGPYISHNGQPNGDLNYY